MIKEESQGRVVIDTELRNKNLIDGYKNISKETDKLINQFEKKVDHIKKEQIALDNLKAKYNQLASGNKAPASLTAMESQFKKNEKEVDNLQKQYDELINKISSNQADLDFAKGIGDSQQVSLLNKNQINLDNQSIFLATELENAKDKSKKLKQSLDELKANPQASMEMQNLKAKIDLASESLEDAKKEANELYQEIANGPNDQSISKFGKSTDKTVSKLEKFKNKIFKLISAVAVFNLIRSSLTGLRNNLISLLGTNESVKNSLNSIKVNLLTAFAPIYNACLPAIQTLMNGLAKLTGTIAIFVSSLFGKSIKDAKKEAQGLTNALKKTKKAQEQLNDSTASFDKLNVIQKEPSSSGADASGGVNFNNGELQYSEGLLNILNKIKDVLSPVWKFIKKIYDWCKKFVQDNGLVGWILLAIGAIAGFIILRKVIKWFKDLKKGVKGVTVDFTGFFNSLGTTATAIAILGGLKLVLDSVSKLIQTFSESGLSLGEVAGLLGIVLGELVGAFILLLGAMKLLEPSWQSIAGAVVIFAGFAIVIESVAHLIDAFANSGLSLNEVIGLMATILISIVALMGSIAVLGPMMTAGLGPFSLLVAEISAILIIMAATLPIILNAVGIFIEQTAPYLCLILTTIGELISNIIYALGTTLPPIIQSTGYLFQTIFSGASQVIKTLGDTMVKILEAIGSLVEKVLQSTLNFINELGPAIDNFVSNTISAVTKLINFIVSGIEYLVNTLVVGGVNKIIEGINSIGEYVGFTIPILPNMEIPRFVPKLAKGAVIPPRHEFAAILGDQKHGTNIEAPLDTIKQANREVLNEYVGSFEGKGDNSKEIHLHFDGTLAQLIRLLKPELDNESKRRGDTLILGGV